MNSAAPSAEPGAEYGSTLSWWLRSRQHFDRLIAAILLVVAGPALLAIGVLIRLSRDKGPAFLRMPRAGQDGSTIRIWKVRTMRVENPDGTSSGPAITAGDSDSRVTAIGTRLRHWRGDELPQLLNVVAGEMTLLGPRPEAPRYVDLTAATWEHVLKARPGIAGPTQVLTHDWENDLLAETDDVDGRYRRDILPVKIAIDRWYVANASPWIDFVVAVSLLQRFIGRTRATWLHRQAGRLVPAARAVPLVEGGSPPSDPI